MLLLLWFDNEDGGGGRDKINGVSDNGGGGGRSEFNGARSDFGGGTGGAPCNGNVLKLDGSGTGSNMAFFLSFNFI